MVVRNRNPPYLFRPLGWGASSSRHTAEATSARLHRVSYRARATEGDALLAFSQCSQIVRQMLEMRAKRIAALCQDDPDLAILATAVRNQAQDGAALLISLQHTMTQYTATLTHGGTLRVARLAYLQQAVSNTFARSGQLIENQDESGILGPNALGGPSRDASPLSLFSAPSGGAVERSRKTALDSDEDSDAADSHRVARKSGPGKKPAILPPGDVDEAADTKPFLGVPISQGVLGDIGLAAGAAGRLCQPCRAKRPDHASFECPARYFRYLGEPAQGFDAAGQCVTGLWSGAPVPHFPFGATLRRKGKAAWQDYITRHGLTRARGKPAGPFGAAPAP